MLKNDETPRRVKIGLLWHSLGSGNLGVSALTESNVEIVRSAANGLGVKIDFIIIGSSDRSSEVLAQRLKDEGHSLKVVRARILRRSFRDVIRGCDLVIDIGEGDSFSDIYGFKRFWYYWLSKNITCSLGVPLVLAPQTIGPFNGTIAKLLAQQVMGRCAKLFARDNISSLCVRELGLSSRLVESTDVAFRLPYKPSDVANRVGLNVGVNVSGLLLSGGYTKNNQFDLRVDYEAAVKEIISYLTSLPDVTVHLISHVIEPGMPVEDDLRAARELSKAFPGLVLAPSFDGPSEAKSYISQMDFFIGARMHSCIAAFSAGVPTLPMSYSRKFNGLFGSLGYHRIVDLKRRGVEPLNEVMEAMDCIAEIRGEVRHSLVNTSSRLKIYEAEIENQIRSVAIFAGDVRDD